MSDYVVREGDTVAVDGEDVEVYARGRGETRQEAAVAARERIAVVVEAVEGVEDGE